VNPPLSSDKMPYVTERLEVGVPLLAAPAGEPDEDIENRPTNGVHGEDEYTGNAAVAREKGGDTDADPDYREQ
jgi:hypothetical protein